MYCVFCRVEKAVELNPDMPLCLDCANLKDYVREYKESKPLHGLDPLEYGLQSLRLAQSESANA